MPSLQQPKTPFHPTINQTEPQKPQIYTGLPPCLPLPRRFHNNLQQIPIHTKLPTTPEPKLLTPHNPPPPPSMTPSTTTSPPSYPLTPRLLSSPPHPPLHPSQPCYFPLFSSSPLIHTSTSFSLFLFSSFHFLFSRSLLPFLSLYLYFPLKYPHSFVALTPRLSATQLQPTRASL
ncbi:hypothetical protein O181_003020 [Austropuccinia psidii MF-1]|uniref:Uncharacterized protein n=1 Tax=Austropuccinia psidii MF-1 TaxID=1389203 RepID=A0A9Q3BE51_9BASI|nr:hypothetical protein [Austropuccinia psidii MF-1]